MNYENQEHKIRKNWDEILRLGNRIDKIDYAIQDSTKQYIGKKIYYLETSWSIL